MLLCIKGGHMEKNFTNYKSSILYCRGYQYGVKIAKQDIQNNNPRQEPFKEDTVYLIGINDGYNDCYKQYENTNNLDKKVKVKKN